MSADTNEIFVVTKSTSLNTFTAKSKRKNLNTKVKSPQQNLCCWEKKNPRYDE